tara:strand:- start:611 stop:796 length:186 start_codon:yes stop_codon:yes gene_type:complete
MVNSNDLLKPKVVVGEDVRRVRVGEKVKVRKRVRVEEKVKVGERVREVRVKGEKRVREDIK